MMLILALLLAAAPQVAAPRPVAPMAPASVPVPVIAAEVVARYPHDRSAFTQGLVWQGGALYESTGREGASEVRRVRLADGRVLQRAALPPTQFGEGLAQHRGELVSLTWRNGIGYRWNAKTLKRTGVWRYTGEGWGLASDGRRLILSDGTARLRFLDPKTFVERGRVTVTLNGQPLDQLNELEWVNGALYANVWHQPYMVRIDTGSGAVTQIVDLRPVVAEIAAADPEAVANGIAWNAATGRLYVTGKLWPTLFEVRLPAGR